MDNMLLVSSITKYYTSKNKKIKAIENLDLKISEGNIVCLLGPNGAGKTTSIKIIGTFVKPTSGNVFYNNISLNERTKYLKHISVLFEGTRSIIWYLKPRENLEYFCGIRGIKWSSARAKAERYMELFGLTKYDNQTVNSLSKGNQQKLAVISVLSLDTDVILLDEPTLGLDFEASQQLMNVIKDEAKNRGKIFIITSHDADFIDRIADTLVIINKGEVKKITTVGELVNTTGEKNIKDAYLKFIREN